MYTLQQLAYKFIKISTDDCGFEIRSVIPQSNELIGFVCSSVSCVAYQSFIPVIAVRAAPIVGKAVAIVGSLSIFKANRAVQLAITSQRSECEISRLFKQKVESSHCHTHPNLENTQQYQLTQRILLTMQEFGVCKEVLNTYDIQGDVPAYIKSGRIVSLKIIQQIPSTTASIAAPTWFIYLI
ncbi:MAG: hypothetical protein EZS28_007696 [Streblomastix strix]|uniref:Uncharacterized protein n=1 Tax=Streblomastix strix TaxID=222440 RepID=A0A5J4WNV6_9EUKA|nr:MAG: hypothetical protein EZS28_007696 [Streblomastix strix]